MKKKPKVNDDDDNGDHKSNWNRNLHMLYKQLYIFTVYLNIRPILTRQTCNVKEERKKKKVKAQISW